MKKDKENKRLQITELFMAMADKERTYVGALTRDREGRKAVFRGDITIEQSRVLGAHPEEEGLYRAMDQMCMLILDYGLHDSEGRFVESAYGEVGEN